MLLALALVAQTSFGGLPVAHAPVAASPTRAASLVRAELTEVREALDRSTLPAMAVLGGSLLGGVLLAITGYAVAATSPKCTGFGFCLPDQALAGFGLLLGGAGVFVIGLIVAVTMAILNGLRASDREPLEARRKALERELKQAEWQERHGRAPLAPAPRDAVLVPVTFPL